MVYIVTEVKCPAGKNPEVAAEWMEVLKKYPPDPSLGKTILVLVRATKEGTHIIGITKPAKGKLEEAILRTYQGNEMYAKIDGLTYEVKTYLDFTEAYKVLDMKPPEEI